MNILLLSHSRASDVLVVGAFQLAREFSNLGHRVAVVGPPRNILDFKEPRCSRGILKKSQVHYVHGNNLLPWRVKRDLCRFMGLKPPRLVTAKWVNRVSEAVFQGHPDLTIIDDPRYGVFGGESETRIIYRPTDVYRYLKGDRWIDDCERGVLQKVHGVIATSEPVAENARNLGYRGEILVLENGVDISHFEAPVEQDPELVGIPRPRIIYFGAVDDRFGWETVVWVSSMLPSVQFVIIGPIKAHPPASLGPNVHLLGPVSYQRIPKFAQHCDAGMLPFSEHDGNRGRSPMKLYEMMAAGLPVIASKTLELERRNLSHLSLASDRIEFASAITQCLNRQLDKTAIRRECARFSWKSRAEKILDFSGKLDR